MIVTETNRYAQQLLIQTPNAGRHSFIKMWTPIDRKELKTVSRADVSNGHYGQAKNV